MWAGTGLETFPILRIEDVTVLQTSALSYRVLECPENSSVYLLVYNAGGEGFKSPLHIPRVYFKRFLPVSNKVHKGKTTSGASQYMQLSCSHLCACSSHTAHQFSKIDLATPNATIFFCLWDDDVCALYSLSWTLLWNHAQCSISGRWPMTLW